MKKPAFLFSLLLCSASFAQDTATTEAPAAAAEAASAPAAPATSAISRLRLFGQNGATAFLYRDSSCIRGMFSDGVEKASGGMSSAFGSLIGSVSNTSLGIPETETSKNLSRKDGIFSKAYFREYEVPADKPSSLRIGFQDVSPFYVVNGINYETVSPSCSGDITFTPRAGEDYEAAFSWEGKRCSISINRVIAKDGKTELVPVPITRAPSC
ncbi:hypothetical protein JAB5_55430 [Janthinobacterium sp. HH103]|uniref:hypothetical protein n=1 Tax=unclassified Janthinobacterium TaxID=2610881 RepID=UPI0008758F26|nr:MULTISPECIES: hypothetical protein [unclassified Janthinobacterium]OEZ66502.1 hypothetical protein JAB2_29320 [Janthinobacterium sp. HH100]OEZ66877.1 hypothetical protein JAB5_55430 [Janthinobacterium sp. HH103]QOU70661.1 hypothetical protein JAB4_000390 [Janthinobacterium sp. HH102]